MVWREGGGGEGEWGMAEGSGGGGGGCGRGGSGEEEGGGAGGEVWVLELEKGAGRGYAGLKVLGMALGLGRCIVSGALFMNWVFDEGLVRREVKGGGSREQGG